MDNILSVNLEEHDPVLNNLIKKETDRQFLDGTYCI